MIWIRDTAFVANAGAEHAASLFAGRCNFVVTEQLDENGVYYIHGDLFEKDVDGGPTQGYIF